MKKIRIAIVCLILIVAAGVWGLAGQGTGQDAPGQVRLVGLPPAGTPAAGFSRAVGPRPFSFPLDYGPHPDFQTEWWYYTGNLQTAGGEWFGYELTFFRRALLAPDEAPRRTSDLAANQVYLAHLALTNGVSRSFDFQEKISRGAGGLAGASGTPAFSVWLENWSVKQTGRSSYHLSASQEGQTLELELRDVKGPVLEGDGGLSQKGSEPGNASYYISQTRLETSGTIRVANTDYAVQGLSWMDHEFSTSALAQGDVGWDWFALQLEDGRELMLYALRKADGAPDEFSSGTLILEDGSTRRLSRADFKITATGSWKSPASGAVYPAGWTVEVPGEGLRLNVTPRLPDQELRGFFIYWEGASTVTGVWGDKTVRGSGYVELTGYAKSMEGQF
jgi:predicted secreted hydrolase